MSHSKRTETPNVYLLLEEEEMKAWGETVFIPYYSETLETFNLFFRSQTIPQTFDGNSYANFLSRLLFENPNSRFAIAGLDIAVHNLVAQKESKKIQQLYNIAPKKKNTSFTISISPKELMKKQIMENSEVSYFKLKVNQEEIEHIIANYIQISSKPFVIDANQGFVDKEKALLWSRRLSELGVAYFEQPFLRDDIKSHQWLKERSPIPIIADESYQYISDFEKIKHAFDGVNIKLMKSGGIQGAYASFQIAKKLGMKTVLGCMSESSVATEAAWHLAPLADWVDLDGPLLIKNDPFKRNQPIEKTIAILKKTEGKR